MHSVIEAFALGIWTCVGCIEGVLCFDMALYKLSVLLLGLFISQELQEHGEDSDGDGLPPSPGMHGCVCHTLLDSQPHASSRAVRVLVSACAENTMGLTPIVAKRCAAAMR